MAKVEIFRDLHLSTGVLLALNAASGVLTLGGIGGTNNENLTLDFETTANNVVIASGTGVDTINFSALNLTTTGKITSGDITILDPTPILVFKDSNSLGAASVGFIEWRDSGGGRAGFFGNSSSGNDDLLWKNEQGGNIGIQTTGAGNLDIIATLAQFNATPITTTGIVTADGLVLPKTSGKGIKVDTTTPTFGFADIIGDQFTKNTGATKPTLATYTGAIQSFQFAAGDEAYMSYHIPHDYVLGADIFLHVHWSHTATTVTGGTITFKLTSIYSKSHDQAPFSAPASGTYTGTASTVQFQQILSEIQLSASSPTGLQIDTDDLEPDGVVEMTFEVDVNNITVSGGGVPDPFIHFVDIHYQTTGLIGTKAKAPDFYV